MPPGAPGRRTAAAARPSVVVRRTRSRSARWIGASAGANSRSRWRQPPHGRAQLGARRRDDDLGDLARRRRRRSRRSPTPPRTGPAGRRRSRRWRRRSGGRRSVRTAAPTGKSRVGRVGAADGLAREREQLGVGLRRPGRGRAARRRRSPRAAPRRGSSSTSRSCGDLLALAAQVGAGLGDRLELEEGAEPADLVEVDADGLPQQQVAALDDDDVDRRWRRRARRAAARARRPGRAGSSTTRSVAASGRS